MQISLAVNVDKNFVNTCNHKNFDLLEITQNLPMYVFHSAAWNAYM